MTRTVMIVGFIAAIALSFGGAALSVAPAWAEETETQWWIIIGTVSGSDGLTLTQQVAAIRAELQKLSVGTGAQANKTIHPPLTPDCASRPEALMVVEAALGLCK